MTVLERDTHGAHEGPRSPRAARRRVPRPLLVLVVVAVVEALTWICVMPPLQGPDEVNHFAYTQKIVEAHTIPWEALGGAPPQGTSSTSTELGAAS